MPVTRNEILVGAGIAVLFVFFWLHQSDYYEEWWRGDGTFYQRVNIPQPEVIRIAALGYDNLVANLLTLQAIQAYGAKWTVVIDEDLEGADEVDLSKPIFDFFDVITELDPYFIDVYEFANLVLSDDRGDHERGLQILRKGLLHNPESWRLAYLGMYTALWGKSDRYAARQFLRYARRIPDTPAFVLRMEEYMERQAGRYIAAFEVNIGHLLEYIDRDSEVEIDVARRKFGMILDGWARYELSKAAEEFLEATGDYPDSIEELLASPHSPSMRIATAASIDAAVARVAQRPGALAPHREEVIEESQIEVFGLPPDPNGYWFYIDPFLLAEVRAGRLGQDTEILTQRHPYIRSFQQAHFSIGDMQNRINRVMAEYISDQGQPPSIDYLFHLLGPDGYGGHFVYSLQAVVDPATGERGPMVQSTTDWRIVNGQEPRMGMQGFTDRFPPRQIFISNEMPPFLTTLPTIWDFEEDINWAASMGMIPGLRWTEQPTEILEKFQIHQDLLGN